MLKHKINRLKALLAAAVLVGGNLVFLGNLASAASLTNTYVRLTRMKTGTNSSVRVVFKTTASAGATGLTVDFNGTDTGTARWTDAANSGVVNATQSIAGVAGCDVSATALPGSPTAAGSGAVVTVSSVTALSANTTYCFDLTSSSAVTTPTTAAEYHPTITETGGATDSITVALRVVSDDQVVVNATVPPSFNFALSCPQSSPNRDAFTANLAAGSVGSTAGCDITVNTNAKTGWLAWASDANTGLTSAAASKTIASTTPGTNATLSAGTEGYVFGVSSITQGSGAGTTAATNAYGDGAGGVAGANQGSGLDTSNRLVASSTGTANGAVVHVKEKAAISAVTPAGSDYTDTITVIGAGNF